MATSKIVKKLQAQKENLRDTLNQINKGYKAGKIEKSEYMEKRFELLEGRFEEDAFKNIDEKIARRKSREKARTTAIVAVILLASLLPFINFSGFTSFVIFNAENDAVLPMNKQYSQNTTEDLTFINATSIKVSGKVHGHGEAWVYLVTQNQTRLVYYADTTQDSITGLVTGIPVNSTGNNTNSNANETNSTGNNVQNNATAENNATNSNNTNNSLNNTIFNETNSSGNSSAHGNKASNETAGTSNQTNTTSNNTGVNATVTNTTVVNATSNNTNTEPGTTAENNSEFEPEILINKEAYKVGENVSISVLPEDSEGTLYMHSPSQTYLLTENYWTTTETGSHEITGLITKGSETKRAARNFLVEISDRETNSFENACIETCTIPASRVKLLILVKDTVVEIDSMSYVPGSTRINETNSTGNATQASATQASQASTGNLTNEELDELELLRQCLAPNPNSKPRHCFTPQELEDKYPKKNFTLVNDLGMTMGIFDYAGNLHIFGSLIENSAEEPGKYDFVVKKSDGTGAAWINALSKDLHLSGNLIENQETLSWSSRQDYIISNSAGMYLGIFKDNGNLHLRGTVIGDLS